MLEVLPLHCNYDNYNMLPCSRCYYNTTLTYNNYTLPYPL